MKQLNLFFFLCPVMAFGQLNVSSNGDIIIGGSLGTKSGPIVFKVGSTTAGRIGGPGSTYVSFGSFALPSSTASCNSVFGYEALRSNTTGGSNTAVGACALYYNTTGKYNTTVGNRALYNNDASFNTAFGYYALYSKYYGHLQYRCWLLCRHFKRQRLK